MWIRKDKLIISRIGGGVKVMLWRVLRENKVWLSHATYHTVCTCMIKLHNDVNA